MARRIAILIATSRYPDEPGLAPLDAPERDVAELSKVLATEHGGVFDEVLVLSNQPSQKVRVQLNRSLRAAAKDDQVLIYFSGHGKLDPTGRLCLTMTDTVLDALESSAVRIGELKDFLDVSRCKNVMLLLDCCYSGAVGKSFTRSSVDDQLQIAAQGAGICIMSASSSVQTALEKPETGLGVFTKAVIEGIQTGAADVDGDGLVTFDELFDYVDRTVGAESHQRPQKWAFQAEGDLLIARTGRAAWEEARQKARKRVLELAATQDLPDEVVADALEALNVAPKARSEKQRLQAKLLEEFGDGRVKPTAFVLAWVKLAATPDDATAASGSSSGGADASDAADSTPAPALPVRDTLATWPQALVDFGRRTRGQEPQELVKIWNDAPGRFDWSVETEGDFFEVDRCEEGVTVTLVDSEPGTKQGWLTIRSNVGEKRLEVRARIVAAKAATPDAGASRASSSSSSAREAGSSGAPSSSGAAASAGSHGLSTTPAGFPTSFVPPHVAQPKFSPGRWLIELKALGISGAKYTLDFAPNGALAGSSTIWGIGSQIAGTWGYDMTNEVLVIHLMQNTFGLQSGDTFTIKVTGQRGNVLEGRDALRSFVLTRLDT
ncbi:MAG: caspase family protein [Planctomycetes bacterium]|nr:caspase family protein [Planctomycetota bacterium]